MAVIPENLVLMWSGTNASVPSGWSRETTLDGRFPKSSGVENPATTGGAAAHTHTSPAHTHTRTDSHGHSVSYNAVTNTSTYGGTGSTNDIAQSDHGHAASTITTSVDGSASDAITYATSSNNNSPPYMDFIFIKASSGAVMADGTIALWNTSSVPINYLMCTDGLNGAPALANKYMRGAPTGADGGTTGGSFTHTHALDHSHSTTHTHTGETGIDNNHPPRENAGGSGGNKTNSHRHDVTLNAATVTTDTYSATLTSDTVEPAYKKLLAIQKQAGGSLVSGLIGLWTGTVASIPSGWLLCNGQAWIDGVTFTPNLADYFIKLASATSEIGTTGGANTHVHAASNSHTHTESAVHTHTGSTASQGGAAPSGGSTSTSAHTHTLASVGNNNATMAWGSATVSGDSSSNQPLYTIVAYIQCTQSGLVLGGML